MLSKIYHLCTIYNTKKLIKTLRIVWALFFAVVVQKKPFYQNGVTKNFLKFTGKRIWRDLYIDKVACFRKNFIKKVTPAQVLSCGFKNIFKNTFFTERIRTVATDFCRTILLCLFSTEQDKLYEPKL